MASIKASDSTVNPASEKVLQQTQRQAPTKRKPKLPKAARQNSKSDVAVTAKAEIKVPAIGRRSSGAVESATPRETKAEIVLKKLRSTKGVSIAQMMAATNWQAHSVRGFLSAVVKKKLGLMLVSEIGKDGNRLYRVDDEASRAA